MKNAYRKIFFVGLSPLVFSALLAIQAGNAAAQECALDSECAEGEFCEIDPLVEYCRDPEPGTEWACENIEDATGSCEDATGRCQDDSDCEENFSCRKTGMGMAATGDCSAGEDCPEQKSVELTSAYGHCRADPIACEDDNDCPSPLFCDSEVIGMCSSSSDGEIDCGEEVVKTCNYRPVECETDNDCESGYDCVEADSYEECSSDDADVPIDDSGQAPIPDEACVGEDCPVPSEPEPMPMPEIECTTHTISICFPARVDCQDDGDCQQGESCFDFSGTVDAPDFWDDDEEAVVCLPDGWVAIFNGHVRGQESSNLSGESADDKTVGLADPMDTNSDSLEEGDAQRTTAPSSNDEESDNDKSSDSDDEDADESDDDSGGCSVATRGAGSIIPCLMLLGFAVARRRFSRSRRSYWL